jgi:hypothetical protein
MKLPTTIALILLTGCAPASGPWTLDPDPIRTPGCDLELADFDQLDREVEISEVGASTLVLTVDDVAVDCVFYSGSARCPRWDTFEHPVSDIEGATWTIEHGFSLEFGRARELLAFWEYFEGLCTDRACYEADATQCYAELQYDAHKGRR